MPNKMPEIKDFTHELNETLELYFEEKSEEEKKKIDLLVEERNWINYLIGFEKRVYFELKHHKERNYYYVKQLEMIDKEISECLLPNRKERIKNNQFM